MNTITITTQLCKEDRQRIDELIAFAGLIVGELKSRGIPTGQEQEAATTVTSQIPRMTQAEDGTVKLPDGTSLRPMTLYALFQDASEAAAQPIVEEIATNETEAVETAAPETTEGA